MTAITNVTNHVRTNILMRKLLGDMRLNRGGFFAVWLVFTLGMIFYSGSYPAGKNFGDSVLRLYARTHLADLWYEFDLAPAKVVEAVRAVDGVQAASGRLVVDVGLERASASSLASSLMTLRLISLPASEADVNNIVIVQGQKPAAVDEIALTEAFALAQGIHIGDTLRLSGSSADHPAWTVRVAGYAASGEYLIAARSPLQPFPTLSTFGIGYVHYESLATWTKTDGQINNIGVSLAPGADLTAVRAAITERLQPYGLQLVMDRHQFPAYATLSANVTSNTQVGLVFSMIFLFGAGAIMAVLLARQVEGERRAIGTLRALGYSRLEVLSYYLAFALIIAVTGALVAVPLGYLLTGPILGFFQRGMVGADVPFGSNPPNWPFILFGVGTGVIMALVAAALPAWRAATTDPGLALRPPSPGNVSRLARIQFHGLPLPARQAVRSLLRAPGRTAGTALGTACGLALIVSCFAVWNVLDYNFNDYYNSHRYDLIVTLGTPTTDKALIAQVGGIGGVTGVETGLIAPVQVQLADRMYTAIGIALDDNRTFTTFDTLEGAPAFSNADGVWLGHNLSRTLKAKTGDMLTVSALGVTRQVVVQGVVKQVLGAPIYVPMSLFSQWTPLGLRPANQAYVRADPARRLDAQRALNVLPGVIGVEDWPSTIKDLERVTAFNGNFALIFLGFGVTLTLVVLLNSISASLHERRNELAIMRTQGVSMGEIRRMVTWEIAIAVGLGLVLGILPTLQLVDYIMQLYDTDVAGNLAIIYPPTWIIAVAILVIAALISQVPPLRGIRAIDLGEVSKSVGV
jgi:putative ABC transport system permease protein